ncbi:MAG TPA: Rieske 2Fe-2S domain-containing protein [Chloroflexota bacterium]|jgi:5,5'-dehydrodivanillate O-demethylase
MASTDDHGANDTDQLSAEADWTDFAHTGPGTLAGRYMRLFWQPVYVGADLLPGRAVPIRIMSEDFTLFRGESALGTPHLLAFRCAHRGTQLSTGWIEGDDIRCFYHGWKYDSSGQCVEQPAEPEPFCQKIGIPAYPTQEYLGLIFAYLGEGEPPPLPRRPAFEDPHGVLQAGRADWPCNFFHRNENTPDLTHICFVHRDVSTEDTEIPRVESADETEFGLTVSVRSKDSTGLTQRAKFLMPSGNMFKLPKRSEDEIEGRDYTFFRVPIDDEHHTAFSVSVMHPTPEGARKLAARDPEQPGTRLSVPELGDAILAGTLHIRDVIHGPYDPYTVQEVQDYVAMVGQGTMPVRADDHLGRADLGISLLRKVWSRELRALAEGRPLTQWTPSAGLAAHF